MKRSIATIGFITAITVFFISILAAIQSLSQNRIDENQKIQTIKSVLYTFGIFPKGFEEESLSETATTLDIIWNQTSLLEIAEKQISVRRYHVNEVQKVMLKSSYLTVSDSVTVYVRNGSSDKITAFGFFLKGKGLWGSITAFAAVNPEMTRMIGIDFTEQVETPGLGARITEQEFKSFFRNLDISGSTEESGIIMVRVKSESNRNRPTNELQAVTGATQTCTGVLNMLLNDLPFYREVIAESDFSERRLQK